MIRQAFKDAETVLKDMQDQSFVDQVEEARRVIKLYHEKGGGSMADPKSGEMIDEATIKIALMDLAKGAQAGIVSEKELKEWSEKSRAITGYDILEFMRRVV